MNGSHDNFLYCRAQADLPKCGRCVQELKDRLVNRLVNIARAHGSPPSAMVISRVTAMVSDW